MTADNERNFIANRGDKLFSCKVFFAEFSKHSVALNAVITSVLPRVGELLFLLQTDNQLLAFVRLAPFLVLSLYFTLFPPLHTDQLAPLFSHFYDKEDLPATSVHTIFFILQISNPISFITMVLCKFCNFNVTVYVPQLLIFISYKK